jgi:nucleoid-associated protein YgaU
MIRPMTERGLPLVNSASACPFVAFENDRDGRATSPDHRHRCYAEIRPAPRAFAHQEAYCLSSAFPVCPTFQDWARREAARARAGESPHLDGGDDGPQRNPSRDWSAPPSWLGEGDEEDQEDEEGAGLWGRDAGGPEGPGMADAGAVGGVAADSAGGAAAAAGMVASNAGVGGGSGADDRDRGPRGDAPDFLADRSRVGAGLAGSAADRLANDEPVAGRGDVGGDDRDDLPPRIGAFDRLAPEDRRRPADEMPASEGRPFDRRASDRRSTAGETRRAAPIDPDVPAWEQPRRYEAYPRLKTRVGLPSLPRVAIMAMALLVAAIALFFLPTLLGLGTIQTESDISPSPSARSSASLAPSAKAAPTPVVYAVQPNDTLEKIRKRFNVTMDALLAANPQIKDPNKIRIGDPITIPTKGSSAPKPSPSGSAIP